MKDDDDLGFFVGFRHALYVEGMVVLVIFLLGAVVFRAATIFPFAMALVG